MPNKIKLILTIIILLIGSNVFAVEEYNKTHGDEYMSIDMAQSIIDQMKKVEKWSNNNTYNTTVINIVNSMNATTFANYFNNTFPDYIKNLGYNWNENSTQIDNGVNWLNITLAFTSFTDSGSFDNKLQMYFIISNNTYSSILDYIGFYSQSGYYKIYNVIVNVNDDGTTTKKETSDIKAIRYSLTNTNNSYTSQLYKQAINLNNTENISINDENSIITMPFMYDFSIGAIYYKTAFNTEYFPYILKDYFNNWTEEKYNPDEPSGDTSGENGGGSGNGVDLSIVEAGIGQINDNLQNIEEKIPSSGDIQQSIEEAFIGDLNEEELKQDQEQNINNIKDQLQEQLENNEVFGALEIAENGFIDILKGEARRL